jgi:zinc protease
MPPRLHAAPRRPTALPLAPLLRPLLRPLLPLLLLAAAAPARAAAPAALDLPIHETTLPNGLRLIVSPSPGSTAAAVVLTFRVGSRDEERGQSGFAHLFEHMMFQGTSNVPKNEHTRLVNAVGGDLNAMTTYDMTQYHAVVPPEQLALALFLEADRLRALALTEETLQNQVDAVREELRERIENATYGPAFLRFDELLYQNWTNAHPVIGDHQDIAASTVAQARGFFERHYAPGNAILVVTGAIDPATTEALVRHYFGGLAGSPPPPRPDNAEPPRAGPTVERLADAHARTPALLVGWQGPPRDHADWHALSVAADVLAGGESSRLYRRLVKEEELAAGVSAGQDGRLGPDQLTVIALLTGDRLERAQEVVLDEVRRLRDEPVPASELEKVRNQTEAAFLFGLRSALGRARILSRLALVEGGGTPSIAAEFERYRAVTAEDVQRVARAWLDPQLRAVLEVVPGPAPGAGGADAAGGDAGDEEGAR